MRIGVGPDGPIAGRRVAVTGMGVVSCCGIGTEALWDGLLGTARTDEHRVDDFDPSRWMETREARHADRFTQFAVAASVMAMEDAGATGVDPGRMGVILGSTVGGQETIEAQVRLYDAKGPRRVSPRMTTMQMPNAAAGTVSIRLGTKGPCEQLSTACATGPHVLAYGAQLVATGRCDLVLAGASEAGMTGVMTAAFANMTALSSTGVSRPFDADRDGFVFSEGAAVLVLEDWDHAVARGARIYAEMLGAASNADSHHITAPAPGGAGAADCMQLALESAGLVPADIGYVNAHGTSTAHNDAAEAAAIETVFGPHGVPVTSNKGILGHSIAACGLIEAVACILSFEHGVIPPTSGHVTLDPAMAIDVVAGAPRAWEPKPIVSNSFGFGGHNGVVIFGPPA